MNRCTGLSGGRRQENDRQASVMAAAEKFTETDCTPSSNNHFRISSRRTTWQKAS